jgi:carboxymethylenebutenolidase
MMEEVKIPTADGDARGFVFTPDDSGGPWPAAIIFMDAPAIRPALFQMGERLAQASYYVLLPDLFWRAGPYDPPDIAKARAGDPEAVAVFQKLRGSTGAGRQMTDTEGCIEFLDKDPRALAAKIGVTGYCMGGGIALRAAGAFPERIAAAACFHGGNLATDDEPAPAGARHQGPRAGRRRRRGRQLRRGPEGPPGRGAEGGRRPGRGLDLEGVQARLGAHRHGRP